MTKKTITTHASSGKPATINGDRRSDKRYNIELIVRWTLVRRKRGLQSGVGRTVDLSSAGLQFEADRPLPVGLNVELSIAWPVLLRDSVPLQLMVIGRIVRTTGGRAGIRITHHEFKTVAVPVGRADKDRVILRRA